MGLAETEKTTVKAESSTEKEKIERTNEIRRNKETSKGKIVIIFVIIMSILLITAAFLGLWLTAPMEEKSVADMVYIHHYYVNFGADLPMLLNLTITIKNNWSHSLIINKTFFKVKVQSSSLHVCDCVFGPKEILAGESANITLHFGIPYFSLATDLYYDMNAGPSSSLEIPRKS